MTKAGRCFSREMQPFWRDAMGRWARGPRGRKQDKTSGLLNKNTIIPPKHPVPTRLAFLPGSRENRTGQCSFGKACQQAAARGSDRVLHLGGPRDIRVPNGCGVRCHSVCVVLAPCTLSHLLIYHTTSGAVHRAQCVRMGAPWQKNIFVDKDVHLFQTSYDANIFFR